MKSLTAKRQCGSVLIISLVILLVLTILGIAGVDTTLLQERMVGNLQEKVSSFEAAEAGLRDGELDVLNNLNPDDIFKSDCSSGLCEPADRDTAIYNVWVSSASSPVYWDSANASSDRNTRHFGSGTAATSLQNVIRQPAYIVERLDVLERGSSIVVGITSQPANEWYRITSRGFGRVGQAQSTVQSVFRK